MSTKLSAYRNEMEVEVVEVGEKENVEARVREYLSEFPHTNVTKFEVLNYRDFIMKSM